MPDEDTTTAGNGDTAAAGDGTQQDTASATTATVGDAGTATSGTDLAASLADADKTGRTIAAIREDFKTERAKRQATEKQLADLNAALAQREEQDKARNLALAKAFGFAPDEPPDPAKLAADLEAARQQTAAEIAKREARERELTIELETRRQAARHGADPEQLADSRSFMRAVGKLDPASDSFSEDLAAAIVQAVTANPSLKGGTPAAAAAEPPKPPVNQSATTAPPARSSGEHNAAPGGNRQWTVEDVQRATAAEVNQAMKDGLLADLGFAAPKSRR